MSQKAWNVLFMYTWIHIILNGKCIFILTHIIMIIGATQENI